MHTGEYSIWPHLLRTGDDERVRNILVRLDATNRTQIVAWVMANDGS